MTRLIFELPVAWLWTVPVALAILTFYFWSLHRRGYARRQKLVLLTLRGVTLLLLLLLIARPIWVAPKEDEEDSVPREVVVLLDRSASMSLRDGEKSRYEQAVDFARSQLLPALKSAELRACAMLFAEDAREVDGGQIARTTPEGRQTDLAAAIVAGINGRGLPPLAVVALTDGAATRNTQSNRAVTLLVENGIPFVGIGFGSETGSHAISLAQITTPPVVAVEQQFFVSVQLRMTGSQLLSEFDLVLLRNGSFVERKRVGPVQAPQVWQESFTVVENDEGYPTYKVQLLPPAMPGLVCTNHEVSASVRVLEERVLRVLFVQGGLTWDYKFVRLAVEGDPSIQIFGLSRTADRAVFIQNVQDDEELVGGFPTSLDRLSRHRVVVLSNLGPNDLSSEQQALLDRFCSDYGGGLLMVGGASTFKSNWQGSRLEKILPVTVARTAMAGGRRARVRPTEAALRHPVFQISDDGTSAAAWASLPEFTDFARVARIKPGAEVWLEDAFGAGRSAPLMVLQRYGNGLSAAICLQNFWRWRLAKNSNPAQFDRFWRQLLRFLAEGSRDEVTLLVPDQVLEPNADIRVALQSRRDPQQSERAATNYRVEVVDENKQTISQQMVELRTGQSTEVVFRVREPGLNTITVTDDRGVQCATRSIEIRDISREFVVTSRNMEQLRQWAKVSGGEAVKAEEFDNAGELVEKITESVRRVRAKQFQSMPAAMNAWTLTLLLSCLCFEWTMRKRWDLV